MIHARTSLSSENSSHPNQVVLHLSFVGLPELLKLQELINKSLNTAPEFSKDYFDLSDKLAQLIETHQSTPL